MEGWRLECPCLYRLLRTFSPHIILQLYSPQLHRACSPKRVTRLSDCGVASYQFARPPIARLPGLKVCMCCQCFTRTASPAQSLPIGACLCGESGNQHELLQGACNLLCSATKRILLAPARGRGCSACCSNRLIAYGLLLRRAESPEWVAMSAEVWRFARFAGCRCIDFSFCGLIRAASPAQ